MKKTLIFGHKNPDTDSVCGAIALSYLKNALGEASEARILSDINNETKYALNYFNIDVPKYLNDVKVKIKDITYHKDYYVNEETSIYDVYNYMDKKNITGIPIVSDKRLFVGYVSLKEIARSMITDSDNYLDTSFDNIRNTLKSKEFLKIDNDIKGNIIACTFDDNTFINTVKLDKDSIVIVGDRKNIIDYAISSQVKLIILIGNVKLSKEQELICKISKINIISTMYSSFEVSKLLGLTNKISSIKRNETCICLNVDDYMTDFIEVSNKTKHTNYPIVNKKGICHGMLRLIDIGEVSRDKVILVDHNESKQSVDGLDEAEIVEIIDHHNISDINTNKPINFRNMSVGSVNTIIYYMYKENGIDIPNDIAGLMISGIISDTVLLNSPTTTYTDEIVLKDLCKQINIDYKEYGMELLKSGMSIQNKTLEEIIYRDFKVYNTQDYKFGIGQVLTVDFNDFNNINDYVRELDKISNYNGYKVVALYITNIISKNSMIIYNTSARDIISDAYNIDNIYEGIIVDGILSRKKQIVPNIMEVLERL